MKIGIFCAIEAEAAPFLKQMNEVKTQSHAGRTVAAGTLFGQQVALIIGGVGKETAAAAAQLLIDRYEADALLITGTAGGMQTGHALGDVVLANAIAYHDVAPGIFHQFNEVLPETDFLPDPALLSHAEKALSKAHIPYTLGRFVTGDAFIDQEGRGAIVAAFAPLCTDMESAAIAHICALYGVPVLGVRALSDTPEHSGMGTFEENCAMASQSCARAVEAIFGAF